MPTKRAKTARKTQRRKPAPRSLWQKLKRAVGLSVLVLGILVALLVVLPAFVPPPTTPYIVSEGMRLGSVRRTWVPMNEIAPVMARAAVAAEDANYCLHWGFDMDAIRQALDEGANRGASTISQQVVKNVYLWQDRSWARKALEAALTPLVELVWSKRRILEVYLNIAEFDEGVFGVEAASRHYFAVSARELTSAQAGRLAAILPDPKGRSASNPSDFVQRRARGIEDGAATIRADRRASCFEGA